MNELHFAYKLRQHLNRCLHELPSGTTDRLAAARQRALSHQKQAVSQPVLATAGNFVQMHFDRLHYKPLLAALLLAACIIYTPFWVAERRVDELSAIDSALLSDELPIGAFTDKGFAAWLRQAAPE